MKKGLIPEKKKIPGLSYLLMANGLELPVLDITHPLFQSSINEKKLAETLKEVEKKGEERAESFNKIPSFIKRFFMKRSFIMADLLSEKKDDSFLSGLSTLLLKMGPGLIPKGQRWFFDRLASKGIGGMVLRMRLRDIARCQADLLIPQLKYFPGKDLSFINIAGGTSCDTINTLLNILKESPELLNNRKIEIIVLDIDPVGPDIAKRCLDALRTGNGKFKNLNIAFRYFKYNWNETEELQHLLSEKKEWLKICSSEGGLFEYADDDNILNNLFTIFKNSNDDIVITGSIMRDIDTIDRGAIAAMKITTIKARMLGMDGLKSILEKTKWKLDKVMETNPRYIVFSLKKQSNE